MQNDILYNRQHLDNLGIRRGLSWELQIFFTYSVLAKKFEKG